MRAFAPLLPVLLLAGCELGHSCNLMYSPDTLTVELDGAYATGEYELEIFSASGDELCTFAVGIPDADQALCTGDVEEVYFDLDAEGAITSLSLWNFAPATLDVVLYLDGVEVSSETLTPDYREDEPNGEGCGVRSFGTVTVAF